MQLGYIDERMDIFDQIEFSLRNPIHADRICCVDWRALILSETAERRSRAGPIQDAFSVSIVAEGQQPGKSDEDSSFLPKISRELLRPIPRKETKDTPV